MNFYRVSILVIAMITSSNLMAQVGSLIFDYGISSSASIFSDESNTFNSVSVGYERVFKGALTRFDFTAKNPGLAPLNDQGMEYFYSGSIGVGKVINKGKPFQIPIVIHFGATKYKLFNEPQDVVFGPMIGTRINARFYITEHIGITGGATFDYHIITQLNGEELRNDDTLNGLISKYNAGLIIAF